LNAAFLDLLLGTYPAFRIGPRTVTYWDDPDIKLEFTKLDDIAAFTALASLDASTPRTLRIVGERISARELASLAQEISGDRFELINGGTIAELSETISQRQAAAPPEDTQLYPDWQRLMYMRSYFTGSAEVGPLDNQRYPDLHWSTARELLQQHFAATSTPRL
jgi:nucleoside-diphosphate-sugar epimerase